MRIDVVTLFPELFDTFGMTSFVGRAAESGALKLRCRSPRDFGLGRHKSVDDTPYGGGSGMVMRVDVIVACLEALDADANDGHSDMAAASVDADPGARPQRAHRVLMTPQGAPFNQARAQELATKPAIALICGRYEGFDERVREHVDEEISLGDFVMTGGEVAAMAVIEATVRLIPGVLGNEHSTVEESHSPEQGGLLEYPHFTRPLEFRGARVPDVLAGGNHAAIAKWRREQAEERTKVRRPDLYERYLVTHPPAVEKPKRTKRR
jgi:tRNA (guanine37-N1)-methyltransferase